MDGMKSDKLWISSEVYRTEDAAEVLRAFAEKAGITGSNLLHMNLLAEETLGMASHMLKQFTGEIWVEKTAEGYDIILEADVRPGEEGKRMIQTSPAGFMAKVAEMLNCSYMFESVAEMPEALADMLPDYISYGLRTGGGPAWAGRWALSAYRKNLQEQEDRPKAEPVLDELEKSIVARLAAEVTIGIQGSKVRMVISGKLS